MDVVLKFLENQIVIGWIAPIVVAAIIGIWGITINKAKAQRDGITYHVHKKETVDIFGEYCKKNRVQPIISYGDSNALKLISEIDKGHVTIKGNVDLTRKPKDNNNRNFVMVLLKYSPKCNLMYFFRKGYSFSFEIKGKEICGLQIEIKDNSQNKVLDEFVNVSDKFASHSFKLKDYSTVDVWKDIGEICFTIFTEKTYVSSDVGYFEIRNCLLKN